MEVAFGFGIFFLFFYSTIHNSQASSSFSQFQQPKSTKSGRFCDKRRCHPHSCHRRRCAHDGNSWGPHAPWRQWPPSWSDAQTRHLSAWPFHKRDRQTRTERHDSWREWSATTVLKCSWLKSEKNLQILLSKISRCSHVKTSPHLGDSPQPANPQPANVMVSYLGNRGIRVHSTSSSCRKTSRSSSLVLGSSQAASMEVSGNGGTQKWMVYSGYSIYMDDLGAPPFWDILILIETIWNQPRIERKIKWMSHNAKDPVAEACRAVIDVFHGNVSGLVEHLSPGKTLTILGSGCFIWGNPKEKLWKNPSLSDSRVHA